MPDQKVVTGTLAEIADQADAQQLVSPMITIVGQVANLVDNATLETTASREFVPPDSIVDRFRELDGLKVNEMTNACRGGTSICYKLSTDFVNAKTVQ